MASVKKFTKYAIVNQLRHNERLIINSSNHDINPEKTNQNYFLSPIRSSYDYFKDRKAELHCHNRNDVKVMAGWVVTLPTDINPKNEERFFQVTYNFLSDRYGEENTIQAIVHKDESQPHLHFDFIPVVPDTNPKHEATEKICANNVLNPRELQRFHPDLQKYLKNNGVDANVTSGITRAHGGNRTVWEIKREREYSRERERSRERSYERELVI